MKKYNLNAQIRIRTTTRAKIDRLTGMTHLTISELIDVLVTNAILDNQLIDLKSASLGLPLVKLGPGGDFVREIHPEDLDS